MYLVIFFEQMGQVSTLKGKRKRSRMKAFVLLDSRALWFWLGFIYEPRVNQSWVS